MHFRLGSGGNAAKFLSLAKGEGNTGMSQVFRPRANTIARLVLCSIAAAPFVILLVHIVLMNTPHFTDQGNMPMQPVPFSHKHHVLEDGIDCRYCHSTVEVSARADVPPTHVCMECHSQLFTHAPLLAPVRASYATGQPLHWQQVNRLPGYVYFDHAVHVKNGIGCTTCHGEVEQMPLMRQAKPLTMGWCKSCHENPGPNLRPPSQIFATEWWPSHNRQQIERLIAHYGIDKSHLTDCSTCHR